MKKIRQRNKASTKEEINLSSWYDWLLENKHKRGSQLVYLSEYHGVYWRQDIEWDKTLTIIVKYVFNVSD